MKLIIDIPKDVYTIIKNEPYMSRAMNFGSTLTDAIYDGAPLEEIPNPCIECSQNCCVCELNGEKCECQKVYVVKENNNER